MQSWSYSQFSAAIKCLKFYKLAYVDKIGTEIQSGDINFGSALHSAINAVLTTGEGEDVFSIYWNSYKSKSIEYGRFKWEDLDELGGKFISRFARLHAPHYAIRKAEERIFAEYKGIKLEGTPDFIGTYRGELSLRDFKTSGYSYQKERAKAALQLNLYAYLAITNYDWFNPKTLGYTVFCKGTGSIQDLTWDFNEKKMYEDLDHLVNYCKLLDKDIYPANLNSCIVGTNVCKMFNHCHGANNENL